MTDELFLETFCEKFDFRPSVAKAWIDYLSVIDDGLPPSVTPTPVSHVAASSGNGMPDIVVNGTRLNLDQFHVLRTALSDLFNDLTNKTSDGEPDIFDAEAGEMSRVDYLAHATDILRLLLRPTPQAISGGSDIASKAAYDVLAERFRQVGVEDFDASHDDMATRGQLALAAASYAYEATRTDCQRQVDDGEPPRMWPWEREWWKPTDRRRDLVKAAALIIAEIERLDRAALANAAGSD